MRHRLASLPKVMAVATLVLGITVARSGARADETSTANAEKQRERSDNAKTTPSPAADADKAAKPAFWPLRISYVNTRQSTVVRLYDPSGKVDKAAAAQIDELLCDVRDPAHPRTTTLDRRTLQLLFRAAYHFRARTVEVISGYRKPGRRAEGRHGEGRAIDFRLPKVRPSALAAYLRTLPRVGVGLYTHRATQFVHLDSRERSYHWLDPSPPGASLPSKPLPVAHLERDTTYVPNDDLPEAGVPEPPPEAGTSETPSGETARSETPSNTAQMVAQALGVRPETTAVNETIATSSVR